MTIMLDVKPETAAKLQAAARALKISLDDYLERVADIVPLFPADQQEPTQPRNEAMFAVLQRSAERMKDVPVTGSTEGTLKIIREARAGAMWGYEPTDTDTD